MAAGTRLSAAAISALASVGLGSVLVRPQVRVAVVSTGAELRDAGQALEPGTIPDSNSLLLAGLVTEHGAVCTSVARSGDTAEALAEVLRQAAAGADRLREEARRLADRAEQTWERAKQGDSEATSAVAKAAAVAGGVVTAGIVLTRFARR